MFVIINHIEAITQKFVWFEFLFQCWKLLPAALNSIHKVNRFGVQKGFERLVTAFLPKTAVTERTILVQSRALLRCRSAVGFQCTRTPSVLSSRARIFVSYSMWRPSHCLDHRVKANSTLRVMSVYGSTSGKFDCGIYHTKTLACVPSFVHVTKTNIAFSMSIHEGNVRCKNFECGLFNFVNKRTPFLLAV